MDAAPAAVPDSEVALVGTCFTPPAMAVVSPIAKIPECWVCMVVAGTPGRSTPAAYQMKPCPSTVPPVRGDNICLISD
jgi:hypothetical protein